MMLYAIVGEDRPDSLAQRLAARPAHVERLRALQDEGRLLLAGPFPAIDSPDPGPAGFSGSLIVAEFASHEAAMTRAAVILVMVLSRNSAVTRASSATPISAVPAQTMHTSPGGGARR